MSNLISKVAWMISGIIDLCISISAAITVSSEIAVAFCISICRLTPVNIIERTDTSNCSASTASSENCQWVMVYWSVSRNIWTCSAFNPSAVTPSVCDGVLVCIWMCGCGHRRTQLNSKKSGSVHHLTQQGMFVNMWWCCSFHFSVWMQIPVK